MLWYYIIYLHFFEVVFNLPVSEEEPKYNQNPEELGDYFEGDIILPKTRNGLVNTNFRWENGTIPYEIRGNFPTKDKNVILNVMDMYKKYTCISFRPRTREDKDYISITNYNNGCWSEVGKRGKKQEVNLQVPHCTKKIGTAIHELMHAVGFLHEQNRFERDDFVTINCENIKEGKENNFDKADEGYEKGFGVPYDFKSVMHYSSTAFSSNGERTITPKDMSKLENMGQRYGFSAGDIIKINAMYGCPEKTLHLNLSGITNAEENTGKENESYSLWELINSIFSRKNDK